MWVSGLTTEREFEKKKKKERHYPRAFPQSWQEVRWGVGEGHSERQGLSDRHEQSTRLMEETGESRQRPGVQRGRGQTGGRWQSKRDRAPSTAAQLQCASFQSKVKIIATPLKRSLLYVFSVLLKEHNFILHQTVMEIWGESTWNKCKKRTSKQQKGLFLLYLKTLELEERELQTYSPRKLNLIFATLKQM